MPETFLATVKSYRSDEHGQATICFTVPENARTPAAEVGKWTGEVLSITACTVKELKARAKAR